MQWSQNPHSTVLDATAKAWHQVLLASEQQSRNVLYFFSSRQRLQAQQASGHGPSQRWERAVGELFSSAPAHGGTTSLALGCVQNPAFPPSCGRLFVQFIMHLLANIGCV